MLREKDGRCTPPTIKPSAISAQGPVDRHTAHLRVTRRPRGCTARLHRQPYPVPPRHSLKTLSEPTTPCAHKRGADIEMKDVLHSRIPPAVPSLPTLKETEGFHNLHRPRSEATPHQPHLNLEIVDPCYCKGKGCRLSPHSKIT